MRVLTGCLIVLFAVTGAAWGRTLDLSLKDAIDMALDKGYQAQQLKLQLQGAEEAMSVARRQSKTSLDLVLNAPDFSENVQSILLPNQLPVYNTVGALTWQSILRLTQPILLTNGRLTVSSDFKQLRESVFQDQTDATERSKRFFSTISVGFTQPLFVPNALKLSLERARLQLAREQHTFTSDQLDVVYSVTQTFYNFYSAQREMEIAQDAEKQQEQSYDLAQKKYEAGLIPEVEALQMSVALARSRNQLFQAEGNASRRGDALKVALGLDLEDSVSVHVDLNLKPFEVDEAKAIAHGLRYRASLRQREISERLAELNLKEARGNGSVRGDLSASYQRVGFTSALPEETSTRDLFDASWEDLKRRPRNLGVKFTLTVPIWDSKLNRARVASAQNQLDQSTLNLENERQQTVLDIRNVIGRLQEARKGLDVLKQSETVAQRSYEIDLARFENGDITAQDLTRTRDDLTQAQQAYLNAFIQYQLAVADLKRQTLYDFENDRSLVGEEEEKK